MQFINANTANTEFQQKALTQQILINQALFILHSLGIPLTGMSTRRMERMALAFLAVADVSGPGRWAVLKDETSGRSLRTRDIIVYINAHFGENISSGSYDDIRRKDLLLPTQAHIVVSTGSGSARNDSTRGYAISVEFADIIRQFHVSAWDQPVRIFMESRSRLSEELYLERSVPRIPIRLPSGEEIQFSLGDHNILQKAVVEEFLPRYGYGAEVLYIGDTAKKFLVFQEERLQQLKFFQLGHGELPDVVAYSEEKNWLYLIEAVHSSGPISPTRLLNLKRLTSSCTADVIYMTAFLDRTTFRKFTADIAWETEVWIASDPDHLIHFNGDKFLGPFR